MKIQFPRLTAVQDAKKAIAGIVTVMNDILSILQREMDRIPRAEFVSVTASATANSPFIVAHSLGTTPTYVSALADVNATVYATSEDRKEWGAKRIKIRCTAANAALTVKVEA